MLKIPRLKKGDTIGVFSSSSPTTEDAMSRLKIYFEKRGYIVKFSKNIFENNDYIAGDAKVRASDFNELISDKDIKLVMTSTGGKGALQMLPYIDEGLVKSNPKIICGLSDPTSILNGISTRCQIPTFHGPNGYNFGHTEVTQFSESNWWKIMNGGFNLKYDYPENKRLKTLNSYNMEKVNGRLFGGNLGVLQTIIGTPWEPDWKDAILFIEERVVDISKTDMILSHLKLAGIFDKIKALIIGEPVEFSSSNYSLEDLESLILQRTAMHNLPIMSGLQVGHTEDKITIPLGLEHEINLSNSKLSLCENPFKD